MAGEGSDDGARPHLVEVIDDRTDILRHGMLCGASYTPGDGDYQQISGCGGTWVLARASDNLTAILDAGLGVLLKLESDIEDLSQILTDPRFDASTLMIAFTSVTGEDLQYTYDRIATFKRLLVACGLSDIGMLIDAYAEDEHLADYVNQPDVKGLLVQHCPFHKIVNIIEAVYL